MKRPNTQILLLAWCLLGLTLRLACLTALPPWTDECATIAFSLGNSFLNVPLDRPIPPDILMQPLQLRSTATVADAVTHLMSESTHPPLYFILSHYWIQGFGGENVLLAARSLSALLGTLAIPAIYLLADRAYRSVIVAQLAAAIMAVSPFGVFLSQEARHYTLAVLVSIASLYYFVVAVEAIFQHKPLSPKHSIPWILINGVGIAIHYFFALVPLSQAFVLAGIWLKYPRHRRSLPWRGIAIAALGTTLSGVAWIPLWRQVSQSHLTDWVYDGGIGIDAVLRAIAWLLSMLLMFPLDILALPLWLVIPSSLAFLLSLLYLAKLLYKPFTSSPHPITSSPPHLPLYLLATLAVLLGVTYSLGSDLTLAPRFFFPVFPAVVVFIAARLAPRWTRQKYQVLAVLGIAFIGSFSILANVGYLQNHRGDRLAQFIAKTSEDVPVLIATTHKHHGQTGRLIAIAWELEKIGFSQPSHFLLAHKLENQNPTETLNQTLAELPKPLDVWLVNFHAEEMSNSLGCDQLDDDDFPDINGYRYDGYTCR